MNTSLRDFSMSLGIGTPAMPELIRDHAARIDITPSMGGRLPSVVMVGTPYVLRRRRSLVDRWLGAWERRSEAQELENSTTTLNILRDSPGPVLELDPPSAWQAAQQLRGWLGVTFDELSAITGIGTSTIHSWRDPFVVPRPSKVRGLWRVFTLARTLQSRLGSTDAAVWMRAGHPTPLEMLVSGRVNELERMARLSVLRPATIDSNPFIAARIEDQFPEEEVAVVKREPGTMRRSARSIKKARRQNS